MKHEKHCRRNKEIVSIRMREGIKKEIDTLCLNLGITRNNFIINCVLKELNSAKERGAFKKKLIEAGFYKYIGFNTL